MLLARFKLLLSRQITSNGLKKIVVGCVFLILSFFYPKGVAAPFAELKFLYWNEVLSTLPQVEFYLFFDPNKVMWDNGRVDTLFKFQKCESSMLSSESSIEEVVEDIFRSLQEEEKLNVENLPFKITLMCCGDTYKRKYVVKGYDYAEYNFSWIKVGRCFKEKESFYYKGKVIKSIKVVYSIGREASWISQMVLFDSLKEKYYVYDVRLLPYFTAINYYFLVDLCDICR